MIFWLLHTYLLQILPLPANSCNEPVLTPKHLPTVLRKYIEVLLFNACSIQSPLSRSSICNKINPRVPCLSIVSTAPSVSAPVAYPCKSRVFNEYLTRKKVVYGHLPSGLSLRISLEASAEKVVVAWVQRLGIGYNEFLVSLIYAVLRE
jgi:hypothetical protein